MRSPRPSCFSPRTTAATLRGRNCVWMAASHKCRLLETIAGDLLLPCKRAYLRSRYWEETSRFPDESGSPSWPRISETFRGDSTESLLMVRLPQCDFVAVGIVYPGLLL